MSKKILSLSFFFISILLLMSFVFRDNHKSEDLNLIDELLEKMHFVQGRELTASSISFRHITEKDTALLFWNIPYREKVGSLYISATEITNLEWWDFYVSMRKKLGELKAKQLYYPDTLAWHREFPYSYNEPMTRNYFWHTDYDNFPVVGISWVQAQAYCKWRTQALRTAAGNRDELRGITFRLPTQDEWELATYDLPLDYDKPAKDRRIPDRQIYPWQGMDVRKDGEYLANFGIIRDENGVPIKLYRSDGAHYTSDVGEYPPTNLGLFDMAGNVAEWVADTIELYDPRKTKWDAEPKYNRHPDSKLYK